MKNTDLRIKNKLQKDNGEIFTVLRIDGTNDVLVEEQRGLLTLGYNLFGIPLTPDWMEKFGFNKRQDYFFLKKNSKYYFFWNEKDGAGITTYEKVVGDVVFDEITIIKKLKYVHELQNLYYTLTGVELQLSST